MRGRKPKPKASAIQPKANGFPVAPARLSGAARNEWERIGEQMSAQLIGSLDIAVLEAYCNAFDRVCQINEEIAKLPEITFVTKGGAKMVSFLMSTVAKQEAHLMKLATELGLTPLSRTRLSAESPKPPAAKPVTGPVTLRIAK